MMEEVEKYSAAAEEATNNDDGEEAGEGEIVSESKSGKAVVDEEQQHPLEHSWTFWFNNPSAKSKQATWGSSIRPIYTFSTVEQFWSLYNNVPHPSKLAVGADFHCFKHKIEPKWEDPVCANGGKWTLNFSRKKSDTSWLYTLLALIGEQFDHGDEICGVVVNVRPRQEKIALWTKDAANETAQAWTAARAGRPAARAALGNFCSSKMFESDHTKHKTASDHTKHAEGDKPIQRNGEGQEEDACKPPHIGRQWKQFLDYNDTIGFIFHEDAKKLYLGAKNRYTKFLENLVPVYMLYASTFFQSASFLSFAQFSCYCIT
ncbi:hypothetical protein HYC85_018058 [Camellia sinensis]|uniref:eIF-4F 25 kDa subunit n=1 Tax=Camellia sinensis TaxID=4442 RepID=A0A7J7GVL5_CAMSI|nr:hypothetical protein HYC85_018058 [Camellia sinensis]